MSEEHSAQQEPLDFCNCFLQLLRLVRLYGTDNVSFDDPVRTLVALVGSISERAGAVRIQSEEGVIFFNREPLRGGRQSFGLIQGLVGAMEAVGVAEMIFQPTAGDPEVRRFLTALKEAVTYDEEGVRYLQRALPEVGLKDVISVNAVGETTGKAVVHTVQIDEATYFPLAYARTLVLLRGYVQNMRQEELNRYFTQKLHRGIQELAGLCGRYFDRMLSLALVRGTDAPVFTHMAATGLLSMLLGHKLGLGKLKLSELGLAAMLSGLGRFRSAPSLTERSQLSPEEVAELSKHPYRALATYLEGRKITAKMLICSTVGFQFDLHSRRTPLRIPPTEFHPYVLIVRICDTYTHLTSDLKDRPALLPDQALKQMIEAPPGRYDPVVLTAFTNLLGLYPTGSVVALSTGEVAVVVHPNPESPRRPLVAVVMDPGGDDVDGEFIDLADPSVKSQITGTVDPAQLGVEIPQHLLG